MKSIKEKDFEFIMYSLIFGLCTLGFFGYLIVANPSEADYIKLLEAQGYSNVELTGYKWFACSNSDWYIEGFKAQSVNNQAVEGVVCKGINKGYTIRFTR